MEPSVLLAINPLLAVQLLAEGGWHTFLVLGSVFLVRHRRRGSLRGHGAFRLPAHSDRLVFHGAYRR